MRRSVSGGIYTLGGTVISWLSKTQQYTTLLSTEAKYCLLSSSAQELLFIDNIFDNIGLLKHPGWIFEDNQAAVFLIENRQVGMHTKHIHTWHHFMHDIWGANKLRVEYVGSNDKEADIFTRKLSIVLHCKHQEHIQMGKLTLLDVYNSFVWSIKREGTDG